MANPGNGLRTVNSLLIEISLHLVENIVNTTLTGPASGGPQTVGVTSTVGMYVGAQVVVTQPNTAQPDILIITAFDPVGLTVTGNFPNAYNSGSTLLGGTFPTQQPTDPLYSQSEIIGYIARAQNEFLSKVPLIFQFLSGYQITAGQINQTVPPNAIELERVAILTGDYEGADMGEGPYGGGAIPVRLYEVSQQQVVMRDPNWQNNTSNPTPTMWFEDRQGAYGWGVAGIPQSNFPAELIYSIRDDENLALTDGFLVPDPMLHYVKYRALSYIFDKDGEARWPTGARQFQKRFDRGVLIADRYLRSFIQAPQAGS
jgi:hypothetical protein